MSGRITRILSLGGLALCLAVPTLRGAQQSLDAALPVPDAHNHVEHMVAMRDGVTLATSVYRPEGEGPWPVIVERTPYSKARGAAKGRGVISARRAATGSILPIFRPFFLV